LAKILTELLFNSSKLSRAFLSTHIIILCDSPISSAFYWKSKRLFLATQSGWKLQVFSCFRKLYFVFIEVVGRFFVPKKPFPFCGVYVKG
ncbi:MAG TPA: hypothetical protein DCS70_10345, partial [Acinetobacter nosocomialis]|nr:hypothetical protein [Acinetobacter nosocomialis]